MITSFYGKAIPAPGRGYENTTLLLGAAQTEKLKYVNCPGDSGSKIGSI
jgi:hypothetical protein